VRLPRLLDDRHGARLTIVTSQLALEHWQAAMGDDRSVQFPWNTHMASNLHRMGAMQAV
jgi:hypothetical protein